MTNEEMFLGIIARIDAMETGLNRRIDGLEERMDRLEERMDRLEERMDRLEERVDRLEERVDRLEIQVNSMHSEFNMEFMAVRMEMEVVHKMHKQDASRLNDKLDRLMFTKDVDGYDKMRVQVEALTQGYHKLDRRVRSMLRAKPAGGTGE